VFNPLSTQAEDLPSHNHLQLKSESVFSKAVQVIAWRELKDDRVWRQGWV
jgi:hypothetical protein